MRSRTSRRTRSSGVDARPHADHDDYHGRALLVMKDGLRYRDPHVPGPGARELTEPHLRVDSIPAIFAITEDPSSS